MFTQNPFIFLLFAISLDFSKFYTNEKIYLTELSLSSFLKKKYVSYRVVNSSDTDTEHLNASITPSLLFCRYPVLISFGAPALLIFLWFFTDCPCSSITLFIIFHDHFLPLYYSMKILSFVSIQSNLLKQEPKII